MTNGEVFMRTFCPDMTDDNGTSIEVYWLNEDKKTIKNSYTIPIEWWNTSHRKRELTKKEEQTEKFRSSVQQVTRYCESHDECTDKCIFYNDGCVFYQGTPDTWKVWNF